MGSKMIKTLSVYDLLDKDKYIVPIYQRNYAWGAEEIELLITDIQKTKERDANRKYYIGSLVVFKRVETGEFEVIDGQQRLTTLLILLKYLEQEKQQENISIKFPKGNNLSYEHREESTKALKSLAVPFSDNKLPSHFLEAKKAIEKYWENADTKGDLAEFFLKNVEIIRAEVPAGTDLNHYFEIMNTRGEQLEKHEVLKARLMEKLQQADEQNVFALIWDACSDINRYMVLSFPSAIREVVFGKEYNNLQDSFESLKVINNHLKNTQIEERSISEIIAGKNAIPEGSNEIARSERFNSVIDFPNFLLHVLRIFIENNQEEFEFIKEIKDIQLDEKILLEVFEEFKSEKLIKPFLLCLYQCRYLFDRYVIKSDLSKENDEHWSLFRVQSSDKSGNPYRNSFGDQEQRKIVLLLSMFHVSYPSRIYKNWLYAVLRWLYQQTKENNKKEINGKEYITYLEQLSDDYYFSHYGDEMDFLDLILKTKVVGSGEEARKTTLEKLLNSGTSVPNFIFNRLDYLIWKNNLEKKENKFNDFRFTFRSSVEHFYPQHPPEGHTGLERDILDNFGNLCLISSSHNSRFTNNMPEAKKANFQNVEHHSLKLALMMEEAKDWGEDKIKEHSKKMKELLNSRTSS